MADLTHFRPRATSDRGVRLAVPLADWARAWRDHRAYRAALRELRALSLRQREDIGVVGLDLAQVARAATYRN